MQITDLFDFEDILVAAHLTSKKQVIRQMAMHLSTRHNLSFDDIFENLLAREKLGSTGVGHGVAIPHARCDNLDRIVACIAVLDSPVDFEAVDSVPTDIIFMMLAPTEASTEHLQALSKVSRLLRNEAVCQKIRGAKGRDAVMAIIADPE